MKILKTTEKVTFKCVDGVEIDACPVSYEKRAEATKFSSISDGKALTDWTRASFFYVKHSVKDIRGVSDSEGNPLVLEFDENGSLTDESAQDAMQVVTSIRLLTLKIVNVADQKMPDLINPIDGTPLEGIEIAVKSTKAKPEAASEGK